MLRQVLILFSGSVFGKFLGIVKEILFAFFFGTSAVTDAYRATITATLAPIHLFTSEALNSVFIPQFCKYRENKDSSAWTLFNGMGLLLFCISLIIGCTLYFLASTCISILFPGFTGNQFRLAVSMLKIMALGIPFYVLSALFISLEIGSGQFRLAALRPLVQNIGVILALIIAFLVKKPIWIAWGFTGTYLFYSLYGLGRVIITGILETRWFRYWNNIQLVAKRFWETMQPMIFFSILIQANIILEKAIASLIGPGAVAAIDYARLLPETAQVLLIAPIGLVSLSAMVNLQHNEVKERSDRISAMVLLILIPLSCFVLVSSSDIIQTLYKRGAFRAESVLQTSKALSGMVIGMWAVCLSYVLQKVYNARLRNREVLRIGAAGICVNALFNLLAYRFLGVFALGLGYSLNGIVMVSLYVRGIGKMKIMWHIAKLCLYSLFPYMAVAILLNKYNLSPIITLSVQMLWSFVFWGSIFLFAPISREMILQFTARLISLRRKI